MNVNELSVFETFFFFFFLIEPVRLIVWIVLVLLIALSIGVPLLIVYAKRQRNIVV